SPFLPGRLHRYPVSPLSLSRSQRACSLLTLPMPSKNVPLTPAFLPRPISSWNFSSNCANVLLNSISFTPMLLIGRLSPVAHLSTTFQSFIHCTYQPYRQRLTAPCKRCIVTDTPLP